jgi:hypothetical protein
MQGHVVGSPGPCLPAGLARGCLLLPCGRCPPPAAQREHALAALGHWLKYHTHGQLTSVARQLSCPSMLQATKSPSFQVKACEVEGVSLLCNMSTGRLRPLVPEADQPRVFNATHGVAHPGIRATWRMVAAHFLWPGMQSDLAIWCRSCKACQPAKVTCQPRAPSQPIAIPKRRFSYVHMDLVGPLPVSADGYIYMLTMIDRTSRWLEAAPVKGIASISCVEAFLSTWVAHFGVPETLTSDRGAQFTSATWMSFCSSLGIKQAMITAYHPQTNGLVERAYRQLKDSLRARQAGVDWPAHLPWVLLGLRAAPKEISGVSSAEAVLGHNQSKAESKHGKNLSN